MSARKSRKAKKTARGRGTKPAQPQQTSRQAELRAQERVIRFVNAARVAEDLMVLPADVLIVDEAAAHMGDIEHHVEPKQTLDLRIARRIFDERREFNLVHGFQNLRDLVAIDRRILEIWLTAFSAGTYGRWDYLYDMEANGVELSIEHAALLRTGEVIFIESGTDTILWDPSDEVTPQFTTIAGAVTGLTADLFARVTRPYRTASCW